VVLSSALRCCIAIAHEPRNKGFAPPNVKKPAIRGGLSSHPVGGRPSRRHATLTPVRRDGKLLLILRCGKSRRVGALQRCVGVLTESAEFQGPSTGRSVLAAGSTLRASRLNVVDRYGQGAGVAYSGAALVPAALLEAGQAYHQSTGDIPCRRTPSIRFRRLVRWPGRHRTGLGSFASPGKWLPP